MLRTLYYYIRPFLSRRTQIQLRRIFVAGKRKSSSENWPVWSAAGKKPPRWNGWPEDKRFALVLTHDVESQEGCSGCEKIVEIERQHGLRSAFGFVPRRYQVPHELIQSLKSMGNEVMVHGLYHDGKKFRSWKEFRRRSKEINQILKDWEDRGFCSPSTMHNLAWISYLNIDYDISTYDIDPFEPQVGGVCRIFPYWVESPDTSSPGYVELPYTLPQDFTLYVLLKEKDITIWKRKLDWLVENGGMVMIKTHPDYMHFPGKEKTVEQYPVDFYKDFLDYVMTKYSGQFWHALPGEVADFWRSQSLEEKAENRMDQSPLYCQSCLQLHEMGWFWNYPLNGTTKNTTKNTTKT